MNPFVYGEAIAEANFINREKEIIELSRDLVDSQKLFLISPRRYGKTSLLRKVSGNLKKKKVRVVYIDLFKSPSLEQFVGSFAKALAEIKSVSLEQTIKFIKDFISSLRPQFTIEHNGSFSLGIDSLPPKRETYQTLENLLEYPQKLANKEKVKVVIMFDEFQEISKLGGESLEKLIRSVIQHQRDVGYVFSGSKKDTMGEMVTKRSRAFYGIGPVIYLEKINEQKWVEYLGNTFKKGGFIVGNYVIDKIISLADNIPYYVQCFAHEIWDLFFEKKKIELNEVDTALLSIVRKNTPTYQMLWDLLPATQRRLLQGLVMSSTNNIFAQQFLIRYQLNSPSLVKKSISLLIKKDIVEKENTNYVFTDLWFSVWIKNTF
ncbi:MAG: ATP-binding protein [Elusimicrobiota bacterium]